MSDSAIPPASYGPRPVYVRRPTAVFVLAVLNIVFGGLGALFSLGSGCTGGYMSAMGPLMTAAQAQMKKDRAEKEAFYANEIAEAKTEAEKEKLSQERDLWRRTQPDIEFATMYAWMGWPEVYAPLVADGCVGLITNSVLIASGIGLLGMRRWARKTAIGVAGVKIVWAWAIGLMSAFITTPKLGEGMDQMMQGVEKLGQQMATISEAKTEPDGDATLPQPKPAAPVQQVTVQVPVQPMPRVGKFYAVMGVYWSLGFAVIATIYPAVLMIVLTRRSIRDSFQGIAMSPGVSTP